MKKKIDIILNIFIKFCQKRNKNAYIRLKPLKWLPIDKWVAHFIKATFKFIKNMMQETLPNMNFPIAMLK